MKNKVTPWPFPIKFSNFLIRDVYPFFVNLATRCSNRVLVWSQNAFDRSSLSCISRILLPAIDYRDVQRIDLYLYCHFDSVFNVIFLGILDKMSCLLLMIILSSYLENFYALSFLMNPWESITLRWSSTWSMPFWVFFDVLIKSVLEDDDNDNDDDESSPLLGEPSLSGGSPLHVYSIRNSIKSIIFLLIGLPSTIWLISV